MRWFDHVVTTVALPAPASRAIRGIEPAVAAVAFAAFCVAVLVRSTALLEPDDLAYRASIEALRHGHLTLSSVEYQALARRLGGIAQWTQLPNGRFISEKNPGYPFFALPFAAAGALRLAPLFYGALGCVGLYAGGRRWLGRFGGAATVVLYLASGAALVFAWRATMPTFTDASLAAGGVGALLWTLLATDATVRRRTVVGLLAFVALEAATSMRYTDAVVLLVAAGAAVLARRSARLPWRTLALWSASVAAFAGAVALFDALVYGGVTRTGYASGEITFSLSAVLPNLEHMPRHLVYAMPLSVLAAAALGWISLRGLRGGRLDAAVAAGLAAVWLGVWGLYAAYDWTVRMGAQSGGSVHVVRFYLPALGAIALLAAWLVRRLPHVLPLAVLAAAVAFALVSYPDLAGGRIGPGGPTGGPGAPGLGPPPAYGPGLGPGQPLR